MIENEDDKEKKLLAKEDSIRNEIINLFESKSNARSYRTFLSKWRTLSNDLDRVITELLELENRRLKK